MTAREDFCSAVREAVTYRSSDDLAAAIDSAGDAYAAAALLALAAELEADSAATGEGTFRPAASAYSHAAQMARERATGGARGSAPSPHPAQSVLRRLSATEDECLEAGP